MADDKQDDISDLDPGCLYIALCFAIAIGILIRYLDGLPNHF